MGLDQLVNTEHCLFYAEDIWKSPLTKTIVEEEGWVGAETKSYSFFYDETKKLSSKKDDVMDTASLNDKQIKEYLEEFFASKIMKQLGFRATHMTRCNYFYADGVPFGMRFNWTTACQSCHKIHSDNNGH